MKHCRHCHCGLNNQIKKFTAGKLGIFGGVLIVGHLLFHVAECLILPAFLMALHGNTAEAASELAEDEIHETTFRQHHTNVEQLEISFARSLEVYDLSGRVLRHQLP